MRMAKCPELHFSAAEAPLSREVGREGARDWASSVPQVDGTRSLGRAPVRKDDDAGLRVFEKVHLLIQPGEVTFMGLVVRGYVPAIGVKEVVEADTDCHLALRGDVGKETAP